MNYTISTTAIFDKWFYKIKDKSVRYRLETRFSRIIKGNFGDTKQLDNSLFELRFFFGGGIRIYYTIKGNKFVLLLCGGDKSSQEDDIQLAKKLLHNLENED